MARAVHIEEFVYRGRPAGSDQPGSWHIRLMAMGGSDDFGGPIPAALSDPLTPEDAAARGYPLPEVLAAINADALAQVTALRASADTLTATLAAERAAGADKVSALQSQLAAAEADAARAASAAADTIAGLRAQVTELDGARTSAVADLREVTAELRARLADLEAKAAAAA